tara:strand:- start:362 stop:742 length:381 start_codon:yes stop_codon:yes gene_type:complete
MKTGRITNVEPNGTFESYGSTLTRNKVTMATGDTYTFNSKGAFKKNIGDEIEFEVTNEQYGNAKLIYNPNKPAPMAAPPVQKTNDVQKFIIRQSSVASAVNFHKDKPSSEDEVLEFAERIVNYIYS